MVTIPGGFGAPFSIGFKSEVGEELAPTGITPSAVSIQRPWQLMLVISPLSVICTEASGEPGGRPEALEPGDNTELEDADPIVGIPGGLLI